MNRHTAAVALAVGFAALAPVPMVAQNAARVGDGDSVSAPVRDVRYDVTFMHSNAQQRVIDVAMSFNTTGTSPVLLSLPAWTPGAYEISNFSRWVIDFSATADGKPLAWDKLDYDTWRVRPAGAKAVRVALRYVADTLDNAMAWAKPDFLLFNGTNVFLYAEGQPLDAPATVVVHTEPDWRVATGMQSAARPHTYTAGNYHDLVDMPFFVGRFDIDSARIADRWVRLATYPAGAIAAQVRSTAWEQLQHVIPPEAAVLARSRGRPTRSWRSSIPRTEAPAVSSTRARTSTCSRRRTSAASSSRPSSRTRSFIRGT